MRKVTKKQKALTISIDVLNYIDQVRGFIPRSVFIDTILRSWMDADQEDTNDESIEKMCAVEKLEQKPIDPIIICN